MSYSIHDLINQAEYLAYYESLHTNHQKPAEAPITLWEPINPWHGPKPVSEPCHGTKKRRIIRYPLPNTTPSLPTNIATVKHGGPKEVSKAEELWNRYETVFEKPPKEFTKPPANTAPTLEGLQHFLKRMDDYEAEWKAIAATQHLELATVGQELAQTGVTSYSLQTNYMDDAEDDVSSYEEALDPDRRTGAEYGQDPEFLNLIRRIEWEQATLKCGPVTRIRLSVNDQNQIEVIASGLIDQNELQAAGVRLLKNLRSKTKEEWADTEARIAYYDGCVGSLCHGIGRKEGQHPETSENFDDLGAEELEENEQDGGPAELGLHWIINRTAAYEPTEDDLWPGDIDATMARTKEDWDRFWAQIEWATAIQQVQNQSDLYSQSHDLWLSAL